MTTILMTHRDDARESAGRTATALAGQTRTCTNCRREHTIQYFGRSGPGGTEFTTCKFCRTETARCSACGEIKVLLDFSYYWNPHHHTYLAHRTCRPCYGAVRRKPTGRHMRPKGPAVPTVTVAQDRERRQYTYREWRCVMAASRRIGLKDPCANDEVVRLMGDPNIYKYDEAGEPVRNNKGAQVALGNVRARTLRQTQVLATALLVAQEAK